MAYNPIKEISGKWQNELGSILTIENIDEKTGYFKGFYQTADSIPTEKGDKISLEVKWPVHGTVSGDVISFIADYTKENPNLCTWLGNIDTEANRLLMHWLLGSTTLQRENSEKRPTPHWAATRIGKDIFVKYE
ncbi:avidin/streptavidin family protein [Emticicia sp. 21SJ11W-3]|uniref:avidin/streptavidin family protein n=1 Tax=Emticicia sp. 21SJ11W-3 TaxID=2916755 RepID=UPI0020A0F807|nr:avidin/streptavidin family protein [Emticicia sp. 21SJ11W-3]UTA68509.1 avidin/streptavidin family protein [Emticicia sp. 21SJ11W-3]